MYGSLGFSTATLPLDCVSTLVKAAEELSVRSGMVSAELGAILRVVDVIGIGKSELAGRFGRRV